MTPFHAEKDGVLAPIEIMKNAYIRTIPISAKLLNENSFVPDGFETKMYEDTLIKENKIIYVIYVGYYSAGELLSVSIWGTNKAECEQVLDILKSIKSNRKIN